MTHSDAFFTRLFALGKSKVNTTVQLSAPDRKAGMKIFCQEDYAQDLYDFYSTSGTFASNISKDLQIDAKYSVKLKSYDDKAKVVHALETNTFAQVIIPVRELLTVDTDEIASLIANGAKINVVVFKKEEGEFHASERKFAALEYRKDLDQCFDSSEAFTVRLESLIDGGYIAMYRNAVRCFLPGSQAAANVIYDFTALLGQDVQVMIENYDDKNNLYIVSHKKFIKHTMPHRVHDLRFGEKYIGKLTADPISFGMFVEWEGFFTGLIHNSEFSNYEEASKQYSAGSEIEFFVKDVTFKKGDPRIVLTLNHDQVNENRIRWQEIRDQAEGQVLDYTLNREQKCLDVELPNGTVTGVNVNVDAVRHHIRRSTQIKVDRVDVLKEFVRFNFVTA